MLLALQACPLEMQLAPQVGMPLALQAAFHEGWLHNQNIIITF
jgi:hypothetical protein